jgi:hypothetical protein
MAEKRGLGSLICVEVVEQINATLQSQSTSSPDDHKILLKLVTVTIHKPDDSLY